MVLKLIGAVHAECIAGTPVGAFGNADSVDENQRKVGIKKYDSQNKYAIMPSRTIIINGECSIGSSSSADMMVFNKYISRIHCKLFEAGRKWIIYDHKSKNGTYISRKGEISKVIESAELEIGDLIILGDGKEGIVFSVSNYNW